MSIVGMYFSEKYTEEVRLGLSRLCVNITLFLEQDGRYLGGQVPIYRTTQRLIWEDGKLDIEVGQDEIQSRTTNIRNSVYSSKYKLQSHSLLL
jgi:hypothetical protein